MEIIRKSQDNFALGWEDDLIITVLNLSHKVGISPSHIAHNSKEDKNGLRYTLTSNKWNKYISLLLAITTAFFACVSTGSAISRASIRSPSIIFMIAPDIGDTFLCFMFWYLLWTGQKDISIHLSLLSLQTQKKWRSVGTPKRKRRQFPIALLCISIVILIQIFDMIKIYNRVNQPPFELRKTFLGIFYQELRRGLLLDDRPGKRWKDMTIVEVIIAFIYLVFTCYFKFVKAFAILLCVAGVIVAFKNAWALRIFLSQETAQLKVIQGFQAFQEYLESINGIIGPLVFGIGIVCAPTFFVANFGSIWIVWNLDSFSVWLTMTIYSCLIMLAAEIPNQTNEYREWILECGQGKYEDELFTVFVELTQNPLGVKGLECFTITYSFMAQMMSTVVTFTIILMQFVGQPDQSG